MSIESVLAENRLIREAWSKVEDGKQLLCLYTAMLDDPDARPATCPASVCPQWLAHLLPWMDDAGTEKQWLPTVTRIARLAPKFSQLSPTVEFKVRALCVKHALSYVAASEEQVHKVCNDVISLCERAAAGETVTPEKWAEAAKAARAARAAARAAEAAEAARAAEAAEAARAAAEAAGAAGAAAEAARAAARAAWAAEAAAAAWAAAGAARAAEADKLTTEILDLIEANLSGK